MANSCALVTATWYGDLKQFALQRASIAASGLGELPHHVVIQTEDLHHFRHLAHDKLRMAATASVLPESLEAARLHARHVGDRLGRHASRVAGSLSRHLAYPRWPNYTGWHLQQISKLMIAAQCSSDYAIIIDSDVIVTPAAGTATLVPDEHGVDCYARWTPRAELSNKERHWIDHAQRVVGAVPERDGKVNAYFDTPFPMHLETLREMMSWLENQYQKAWWQVLLNGPPRHLSEFAMYKAFLARRYSQDNTVKWRDTSHLRYIYAAGATESWLHLLQLHLAEQSTQFITLHSKSKKQHSWLDDTVAQRINNMIQQRTEV